MSNSLRRPRSRPRKVSTSFYSLGWLIRRVAVWQTLYGWWTPWMKPALAQLFLSKNWKHLECAARKAFAEDARRRLYPVPSALDVMRLGQVERET